MTWKEVGDTTLTQAALLQEHIPYVSPHYDTSEIDKEKEQKASTFPAPSGTKTETVLHDFRMNPTQKESVDRFGAVFIPSQPK